MAPERIHQPCRVRGCTTCTERMALSEAVAYGWDGGAARACEALRPYVRHVNPCLIEMADPWDERCVCGLRQAWRIRETPEGDGG